MAKRNAKDLSILVVDDTKFGRAVFYSALNHAGYVDVRIAESAPHALETLSSRRADVVVADWLMPEMDGLELTQRIREQDEKRHSYTAIILATAQEGTDPLVTAFKRGVDDFIRKPFDNEELVARVYAAGRTANLQTALLETAERLSHSNRQLSEDSMTDSLTKLGNRNYLVRQLGSQLRVLDSRGGGVGLALMAVDNLAELVAEHGQGVGNELLLGIARRFSRSVRPMDIICHLEREIFALLLFHHGDPAHRPYIFERLRHEIGGQAYETAVGEVRIDLRIGAVHVDHGSSDNPQNLPGSEDVIKAALARLDSARGPNAEAPICAGLIDEAEETETHKDETAAGE